MKVMKSKFYEMMVAMLAMTEQALAIPYIVGDSMRFLSLERNRKLNKKERNWN